MRLFSVLVLVISGVVSAANFAASGEIQGSADGVRNIATWHKTSKRMAIFDAGGFSAKDEKQNAVICSLMQSVDYSAIGMGFNELRFSADYWENMNKKFKLPLVATNVKSSTKIFEKIRTVQYDKSGEKYAVIAIIGENVDGISSDYEIEDPRAALASIIPQIPNDYIIVLIAYCEPALADSLVNEFPRISFGVQGSENVGEESFRFVGHKKILQFGGADKIAILDKKSNVSWRRFYKK